ncbi:mechanosensitive ion channel family protein [Luteimonas sp. TWI1437]|uniref:mechanosensitive ion channel family protein n=1 Tax=unclassified Luteimonas TaxID=2629088 RepID=UPI0032098CF6
MGVRLTDRLPPWLHDWLDIVVPGGQILLILLAAWLLRLLGRRLLDRVGRRYTLPPEAVVGARRVMTFLIYAAALLMALERLGVSGTVLWTAFTGFAAVGAVAFFAAWSVLSNIFCTMLILTTRPFRLYDHVELLENGEKPGLRGQVVDINLVYTTLRETDDGDGAGTVLQVPNSLFFQRALRRWRGGALPEPKGAGAKRGDPLDV